MKLKKIDDELYVDIPKKEVKVFFADDVVTEEDKRTYDIVQLEIKRGR
jgi:uncharacterized protein YpmB